MNDLRDIKALLCGLAIFVSCSGLAYSASTSAVMLEIVDGDTAFMIDEKAHKAWWVVGECRRALPLEKPSVSSKKSNNSMTSKMISEDVRIGSRPVELRQQFRFNMAIRPASVEVYNSVRGGWSSVPVQINEICIQDTACRSRMELPEC